MKNLGERLKKMRKSENMTLKQIAEKTDLSISFLSQVEHAKSSITLESLMKISEVFDVNPSYFFTDGDEGESKKKIAINNQQTMSEDTIVSDFTYRDLSGEFPKQTFSPTLVTLQPRKEGVRPLGHSGQEFIFVLKGTLTIIFDNEEISLKGGESIHMESTIPHNWMNKTGNAITFLYISSH